MPPAPGDVEARDVWAAHGAVPALRGVTVVVPAGAVVAVVGPNGAGKTTLLRVLAGLHPPQRGRVLLDGEDLTGVRAHRLARRGVVLVPEGSGIFPGLTVGENLRMGRDGASEEALRRFPVLRERIRQRAGTLSGGEQQMLALARCVSSEARVVMLDEPSLGLAPRLVDAAFDAVASIRRSGRTVVLVEQHVRRALEVADLVYVLRKGERVFAGEPGELEGSATLEGVYLGRAAAARRGRGR